MLKGNKAFSGFSVGDLGAAKEFYGGILGLDAAQDAMGLTLQLAGGNDIFVYQKDDHVPASYTILNFVVDDIDKAVDELVTKGVKFEQYDFPPMDKKNICRGRAADQGPDIAWFKDPAGNILSVLQN